VADQKFIQEKLTEATKNPELAQSIATALCDTDSGCGYKNVPEDRLEQIGKEARKAASQMETTQTNASFAASIEVLNDGGVKSNEDIIAEKIPSFRSFYTFIDLLLSDAEYTHGAIIHGDAGIGKTKGVEVRLARSGKPYAFYNSYSTPLAFYELLYHDNGKTIVLDDVNTLLKNPASVAILKAALFSVSGQRLITYSSTAKVLEERGIPARFIFTGRIIIIMNEIPTTLRETFQALLSRTYEYQLRLSQDEKMELIRIVFDSTNTFGLQGPDKLELIFFLEKLVNFGNLHQFNIRTALRSAEIWAKLGEEKAKPLIIDLMDADPKLKAFLILEDKAKDLSVKRKVSIWEETTGYSRRAYFEIKSKYFRTRYGREKVEELLAAEIERTVIA